MTKKTILKNFTAAVLMFVMAIGLFSTGKVYAAPSWIEIWDADDLIAIRSDMTADYKLMADIDLGGVSWTPLGSAAASFTGVLDGNSKVIKNFIIYNTSDKNQGLFSVIGSGGQVRNLGLTNVNMTAGNYTGMLAGVNNGTINRCFASGSVTGQNYVGGLVGQNSGSGSIVDSYTSGFVGENSAFSIRCYSV